MTIEAHSMHYQWDGTKNESTARKRFGTPENREQ